MPPSDEQLITAYLEDGDQAAFRNLVERHQERIYGYLMGMVRNRATADDLFQETFIRAIDAMHDRRGSYSHDGRWIAWIMRIARNAALDYFRSSKRQADVEANGQSERSFWDELPARAPSALDQLHRKEQGAWLESCIDRLPDEQREVVLLRQDTDLTFREIAELTDCSINTALGRMRYALKNLHKMIDASDREVFIGA